MKYYHRSKAALLISFSILFFSCNKMLEIAPPVNSITTDQIFQNDEQALIALNGLYSYLIHGGESTPSGATALAQNIFSAGAVSIFAGFSSDELYDPALSGSFQFHPFLTNTLNVRNATQSDGIWSSAYKAIYNANALIEGVDGSTSTELTADTRQRIKAEAKTVRAMSYFYLVNFYEKIPLVLTIDFNRTKGMRSSTPAQIYTQIINDLEESIPHLSDELTGNYAQRVRVTSWFARSLLARVYLFTKNNDKAWSYANEVLEKTNLFTLEPLNITFKKDSREVIFQLKHDSSNLFRRNAVPESLLMYRQYLTPELLASFDPNDQRRTQWIAAIPPANGVLPGYTPSKYKINNSNYVIRGPRSEYYVVMRLAELYLIRAEANFLRNTASKNQVIDDLNFVRSRAGADALPYTLTNEEVTEAIANERRIELFAEWGHRWMDLKRTGTANAVLSQIIYKQPWAPHQMLYPVPLTEIEWNNNLSQNELY